MYSEENGSASGQTLTDGSPNSGAKPLSKEFGSGSDVDRISDDDRSDSSDGSVSGDNGDESNSELKSDGEEPTVAEDLYEAAKAGVADTVEEVERKSSSWSDLDLSIVIALVAPIGNWLTGTDHLKNLFLICLLIFYLHQLIEVPWHLYQSALPRRRAPHAQIPPRKNSHLQKLARSELRTLELIYLCASLISPFIGATLLRHVLSALSGSGDGPLPLSWFSTTLFILAIGIRPWSHFIRRLRSRTQDLHDTVHFHVPSSELRDRVQADDKVSGLLRRVETLEAELAEIKSSAKQDREALEDTSEELSGALNDVERTLKRQERKAEGARAAQEKRLAVVETTLAHILDERKNHRIEFGDPLHASIAHHHTHPVLYGILSTLFSLPYHLWSLATLNTGRPALGYLHISSNSDSASLRAINPASPKGSPKGHISRSPRLETIVEDSDDATLSAGSTEATHDHDAAGIEFRLDDSKGLKPRRRRTNSVRTSSGGVQYFVVQLMTLPYRVAVGVLSTITLPLQKMLQ